MPTHPLRFRAMIFLASIVMLLFSGLTSADPPSRVARLGYLSGTVSFSPAGENDWDEARLNRPLTTGDRLWVERRARAEVQIGGAAIRLDDDTAISLLNLDDRITQLQLTQGVLNVRVRRLDPGQSFEIATPNLAFVLRQPGAYRIEVDPDDDATTIIVRSGQGEVYGENTSYLVDSRQAYRFMGTGLRDYEYVDDPRPDEFDRWSSARDRAYDNSLSARYVSQDVVGYQDLDTYGRWRVDATYGNIWIPSRVTVGWAPYRHGHWAWIDPWGWTWIDDAPWGFAVSHYGRWVHLSGSWCWVPGPVRSRAYYAPALVVFVGSANFQLTISSGISGIAWFPLGPREVYRPAYPVSRRYFENINRSNTVINTTVINNYYNNVNITNVVYVNREVPGAVVAVPRTAFVQSQPVSRSAVQVSREMIAGKPLTAAPSLAPTQKSVRGAAPEGDKPPQRVFERPVVARTAPPAAHAGFAAQQPQLATQPGKPLDDTARRQLKPAATAPAPAVKMVAPANSAQPRALPAPTAPEDRAGTGRGRPEPRGNEERRTQPVAPQPAPVAPQPQVAPRQTPPAAPPAVQEQRGRPEPRGNEERRTQPVAPQPAPAAPQPQVAPRPAAPATPPAVQEPRGRPESRGNEERRGQPVAPQPAPAAPQPQVAPRPAAPATPPAVQEPRGRPEPRGNEERRGQPVAPQPAPVAPQPQVAPRQAPPAAPPAVQEPRGRPESRGNEERRTQPVAPPPRAAEPQVVPPPQRPDQTRGAPPPRAVPSAPSRPQEIAPQDQNPKPAVRRKNDGKTDSDERLLEEENRRQGK